MLLDLRFMSDPTSSQEKLSEIISWASAHSCDSVTYQLSKHFVPNLFKKDTNIWVKFTVVREGLCNNIWD